MRALYTFIVISLLISSCATEASNEPKQDNVELIKEVVASYPNGNPKSEVFYKPATIKILKQILYYENGSIQQSGSFNEQGRRDGVWASFFEDGKDWSLNTYKDGKLDGEYKTWFENGNLRLEGTYIDGEPSGTWKYYDEDGSLVREDNR